MNSFKLSLQFEQLSLAPHKLSPAMPTVINLGFSANMWGLLDYHQYGSSAYKQKKWFKKIISLNLRGGGEQEQTDQEPASWLAMPTVYCFPLDQLSQALSVRFFFWDSLSCFPPDSFLLLPRGFWGLRSRTQASCPFTSLAQKCWQTLHGAVLWTINSYCLIYLIS